MLGDGFVDLMVFSVMWEIFVFFVILMVFICSDLCSVCR